MKSDDPIARLSIRVDLANGARIGPGKIALLQEIARSGSISGAGRASIAPASAADLKISGSGEIDLLSHPAKLTSDVSGAGRIVEGATGAQPDAKAPAKQRTAA